MISVPAMPMANPLEVSALEEAMVDTKTVRRRHSQAVNLRGVSLEDLLFGLLEHLLFLKDAKGLLFRQVKLGVSREDKSWVVQGFAYGEKRDDVRHTLKVDVRGISKKLFELKKEKNVFRTQVFLES